MEGLSPGGAQDPLPPAKTAACEVGGGGVRELLLAATETGCARGGGHTHTTQGARDKAHGSSNRSPPRNGTPPPRKESWAPPRAGLWVQGGGSSGLSGEEGWEQQMSRFTLFIGAPLVDAAGGTHHTRILPPHKGRVPPSWSLTPPPRGRQWVQSEE